MRFEFLTFEDLGDSIKYHVTVNNVLAVSETIKKDDLLQETLSISEAARFLIRLYAQTQKSGDVNWANLKTALMAKVINV